MLSTEMASLPNETMTCGETACVLRVNLLHKQLGTGHMSTPRRNLNMGIGSSHLNMVSPLENLQAQNWGSCFIGVEIDRTAWQR